jgi:hypothetical protein
MRRLQSCAHEKSWLTREAAWPVKRKVVSLMGHMSRAMLERYSHIRMAAKREAVESLSVRPKTAKTEVVSTVSTTVDQPGQIQRIANR